MHSPRLRSDLQKSPRSLDKNKTICYHKNEISPKFPLGFQGLGWGEGAQGVPQQSQIFTLTNWKKNCDAATTHHSGDESIEHPESQN